MERTEHEMDRLCETEMKLQDDAQPPMWQRLGMELVLIPEGEFLYGREQEKIWLPAYWLGKRPVSNAQYKVFLDATGSRYVSPITWYEHVFPEGEGDEPVVYVGLQMARAFCAWAGLRLPTEQEWEKGARGTDGREYPWGNEPAYKDSIPVVPFPLDVSPYGLIGMAFNVSDWCDSHFDDTSETSWVVRGNNWHEPTGPMWWRYLSGAAATSYTGFRCARSE